jgi:exonuclease III
LIDYIFVSHALLGKIAQDHVTTDATGPTPSINEDPTARRGAPGSDHRPVLASIDL